MVLDKCAIPPMRASVRSDDDEPNGESEQVFGGGTDCVRGTVGALCVCGTAQGVYGFP
jgi:hypothetical protein